MTIKAIISISTKDASPTLLNNLLGLSNVKSVYETTGNYDVLLIIELKDVTQLNSTIDTIKCMKNVVSTNTVIILKELV